MTHDIGPSGHYPGLDEEMLMDELELGFRVARHIEDEAMGFGPLFNEIAGEHFRKEEFKKMTGNPS